MEKISKIKMYFIFVLTGINFFLAGIFYSFDWGKDILKIIPLFPFYLKGLFSLICTIAVWSAGKHAFDPKDSLIFRISFLCTFIGDIGFLIPVLTPFNPPWLFIATMAVYIAFHCLSIIRYMHGIKEPREDFNPLLFRIFLGVIIYGLLFFIMIVLTGTLIKQGLLIPVVLYGILLTTDVFFGINTLSLRFFPLINARLIATGVILFFFCDMAEAWKIASAGTPIYDIAVRITWIFYGPSLILISLSGYLWHEERLSLSK